MSVLHFAAQFSRPTQSWKCHPLSLISYGECIADAFGGFRIVPLQAKFINEHSVSLDDVCSQAANGIMYGVMSIERFLDARPRTNVCSEISRQAQLGLKAPYEMSTHLLPPYTRSAIGAGDPSVFFVGFYRSYNVNANIKFIYAVRLVTNCKEVFAADYPGGG